MKTILTSHINWSFGLGSLRLNTPFPYCTIRGWSESFVCGGMKMIRERALFEEFIALYDRPWSYKFLKKSRTLIILGVTGLILFSWLYMPFLLLWVVFFLC